MNKVLKAILYGTLMFIALLLIIMFFALTINTIGWNFLSGLIWLSLFSLIAYKEIL